MTGAQSHALTLQPCDCVTHVLHGGAAGARAFAPFDRMAGDVAGTARDIRITTLTQELCACAARYPEMSRDKAPFEVSKG